MPFFFITIESARSVLSICFCRKLCSVKQNHSALRKQGWWCRRKTVPVSVRKCETGIIIPVKIYYTFLVKIAERCKTMSIEFDIFYQRSLVPEMEDEKAD